MIFCVYINMLTSEITNKHKHPPKKSSWLLNPCIHTVQLSIRQRVLVDGYFSRLELDDHECGE